MATEALDQSVVLEKFKEKLLGRYYLVKGPKLDRNILVEDISLLPPLELDQIDTTIARMEV